MSRVTQSDLPRLVFNTTRYPTHGTREWGIWFRRSGPGSACCHWAVHTSGAPVQTSVALRAYGPDWYVMSPLWSVLCTDGFVTKATSFACAKSLDAAPVIV